MTVYFYINSAVAVLATLLVVTARQPIHALLYFVLSLISLAISIYMLAAPFAAALEVIVYAGAIMVLFVFVVMLLNVAPLSRDRDHGRRLRDFSGPIVIALLVIAEVIYALLGVHMPADGASHSAKDIAISLYTTYGIGVEIASFLLLAGLVGAYHIGRKR